MGKVIRLTESQLKQVIRRVISENEDPITKCINESGVTIEPDDIKKISTIVEYGEQIKKNPMLALTLGVKMRQLTKEVIDNNQGQIEEKLPSILSCVMGLGSTGTIKPMS